jgi:DNA helicase HerA-like ATPase
MNINELLYNIFWITFYVIFLFFFVWLVLSIIGAVKRKKTEASLEYNLTFLQVRLPADNEIEIKSAEHLFSNLMGFKKGFWQSLFSGQYRISFEIVAKSDGIGFYVVVPDDIAPLVEKQINAAYPSAEIDIVDPQEIWDRGEYTRVAELKLRNATYYPIKVYEDLKNDSLSSISNAMSKLDKDAVIAVQYVVQPAPDSWRSIGQAYINRTKQRAFSSDGKATADTSYLETIEKKISSAGFYTKVRVISIHTDKVAAENNIRNLVSAFEQFTDVRNNKFYRRSGWGKFEESLIDDFIYRRIHIKDVTVPVLGIQIYSNTSILNTVELATIFHFPNKNVGTPNIMWLTARRSSAPTNVPDNGMYLGKSIFRGVQQDIYMKEKDRARHFYIIGQTGTGKSQFMMSMVLQDIQNGEGVALIDPHGTDIDELLEKIPPEREKDVILFDAADTERPLGINLLEAHSEDEKHMIVNSFIALLYKLYDPNNQGIMGPQLERAIRNVMLTAMVDPDSTMVDVLRLLIDTKYANKFISKLEDPMVKRFWTDEMAKTSDYHKSEKMGYFVSKFDRFVTERLMRNILGQPKSAINFHEIMSQKKILLVDLAKGKIGEENSNFIGLLLVPRILAAALARHKYIGKQDFPNFFLYVDEFQNFATPDFATILSEARKYKLNLVVAHQFVSQLQEEIKNAIFGNVGTMTVFRVGSEDAEYLKSYFEPTFTQADLANLSVGNCYTRLLVDGQPTQPFSMKVDWDKITNTSRDKGIAQRIREHSRNTYGTPIAQVEEYINQRAGFNEEEKAPVENPFKPASKLPF